MNKSVLIILRKIQTMIELLKVITVEWCTTNMYMSYFSL